MSLEAAQKLAAAALILSSLALVLAIAAAFVGARADGTGREPEDDVF